ILYINGLTAVKRIGSEFYGGSNASSFPSLEYLNIGNMMNLRYCRELKFMPNRFPSLKTLKIEVWNGKLIGSLVESNQASLTSIGIKRCEEGNNILCRLKIEDCHDFQGFTSPNMDLEEEDDDKDNCFPNQKWHRIPPQTQISSYWF
ncbi:hypothetical protein MKW92_039238, partial [Papaver armeniacum]